MAEGDTRPWHRRCTRWGQTNLTERDPARYDAAWWRGYWRRTRIHGVIVNAGGIVAYYPSRFPLHHRAEYLGDRDLYGEIVAAAREEGLAVLARMDSNRADADFYREYPDWFAADATGEPYRAGEKYIACVNGPYYREYLPDVMREIIERSRPDGFTDNSWSGLERSRICYCGSCRTKFRTETGHDLPAQHDWSDPAYREWIAWSYRCRLEVWDVNNRVTREAGGPDCLWIGMNSGDILRQGSHFRDYKAICERAEILMLDSQWRVPSRGFEANTEMGQLIHGLMGWDKLIPESTALYAAGNPTFRVGSKPEPEARMWAVAGFAGGIQPWWHHIGAYHEDRRQYRTAELLFRWHEAHEQYLIDREPVATVGVVWSQENADFYGRDAAEERVALPQRGVAQALIRARIPFLPIHADHIARDAARFGLAALVLPNVGAMTDAQCDAVRAFAAAGGGVVATGETSRYDAWGEPRPDFALADVFGAHTKGEHRGSAGASDPSWEQWAAHSYLRLAPELRANVDGPHTGDEPAAAAAETRHPALVGFDETDLLPFGGRIEGVRAGADAHVVATYVPPFPIYPPELAWMREPTSDAPALVLRESAGGGRVAYLAADVDRCFGRDSHPDHARLLENLVRWAARDAVPLAVEGPGLLHCTLYRQPGRLVLHLVNLTGQNVWRGQMPDYVPVGPLAVRVRLPEGVAGAAVQLLVAGETVRGEREGDWLTFAVPSVRDHEVLVVGAR